MDIWVKPTRENYSKLGLAFSEFGMPVFDMTLERFLNVEKFDVFSYGQPPSGIYLMTATKGLDFDEAYARSAVHKFEDIPIRVVRYDDLLKAKEAAGRQKDLNDIEQLKKGRRD